MKNEEEVTKPETTLTNATPEEGTPQTPPANPIPTDPRKPPLED